jgi:hypothetical protein
LIIFSKFRLSVARNLKEVIFLAGIGDFPGRINSNQIAVKH